MSKFCVICKTNKDSAIIKFPKDPALRDAWIENTNVSMQTATLDKSRICTLHFEDDQWEDRLSRTKRPFRALKKDAVPTLYVGEEAPLGTNITVPKQKRNQRCALCNVPVIASHSVSIFEKDDSYTDFGAALAYILRMTSKSLASRYCCVECSEDTFGCFGNIVNINMASVLVGRMNETHEAEVERLQELRAERLLAGDDTPLEFPFEMKTMAEIKEAGIVDEQDCVDGRCQRKLTTLKDLTDHLTNHFFESKPTFQRSIGIVQTDEFDIDLAAAFPDDVSFSTIITPFAKKSPEREELHELTLADLGVKTESDFDSAMEVNNLINFTLKDESEFIEERLDDDDTILEEHLIDDPAELPANDLLEEGLEMLSDNNCDPDYTTPRKRKLDKAFTMGPQGGICHVCGRTLKSTNSLKQHMKMHAEGERTAGKDFEPRDCEICGVTLKHYMSYKQHVARVHSTGGNHAKVCDICNQVRGNLTQHKKTCRLGLQKGKTPSSSTCGVCGKIFASRYMSKHLKLHTMEEDIARNGKQAVEKYIQTCGICGQKTQNLTFHNQKKHKDILEPIMGELDPDTSNHDCRKCGAKFEQRPLLVTHLVLKHGFDPKTIPKRGRQGIRANWKCSICHDTFHTYSRIKRHTQAEHNGVGINLTCENCGKRYNTIEALREHINVKHIGYYPYNCYPCDKHFVNQETYEKHLSLYCRLNGSVPKRSRTRIQEESIKFEPEDPYEEPCDNPLVDMTEVEELDEVEDIVETVYVPQDNMVVVYEESVPFRS